MSPSDARSSGRGLIVAGVVALALCLVALAGLLAWVSLRMVELGYGIDPATGFVREWNSEYQRALALARVHDVQQRGLGPIVGAALGSMVLIIVGVQRAGRVHGLRLGLPAMTVLGPLVIGLGAGLLSTRSFEGVLADIHAAGAGEPGFITHIETAVLEACSHARGFAIVQSWSLALAVATFVLFVPAARVAWRAGVRGLVLAPAAQLGCLALFVFGAAAVVATRPHAQDRQALLADCGDAKRWVGEPPAHRNLADPSIRAIEVQTCQSTDWLTIPDSQAFVGAYQLSTAGPLATLPNRMLPDESGTSRDLELGSGRFAESLDAGIVARIEHAQARGRDAPTHFIMLLYADERTPVATIAELFSIARAHGVAEIGVLASVMTTDELRSVGTWRRRTYCEIARLAPDELSHADSQRSWGEWLSTAAN